MWSSGSLWNARGWSQARVRAQLSPGPSWSSPAQTALGFGAVPASVGVRPGPKQAQPPLPGPLGCFRSRTLLPFGALATPPPLPSSLPSGALKPAGAEPVVSAVPTFLRPARPKAGFELSSLSFGLETQMLKWGSAGDMITLTLVHLGFPKTFS